jgi:hypothetical protein
MDPVSEEFVAPIRQFACDPELPWVTRCAIDAVETSAGCSLLAGSGCASSVGEKADEHLCRIVVTAVRPGAEDHDGLVNTTGLLAPQRNRQRT